MFQFIQPLVYVLSVTAPHRYLHVALTNHCRRDNSNDLFWFLFLVWSFAGHFDALIVLHVLIASNSVEPILNF